MVPPRKTIKFSDPFLYSSYPEKHKQNTLKRIFFCAPGRISHTRQRYYLKIKNYNVNNNGLVLTPFGFSTHLPAGRFPLRKVNFPTLSPVLNLQRPQKKNAIKASLFCAPGRNRTPNSWFEASRDIRFTTGASSNSNNRITDLIVSPH